MVCAQLMHKKTPAKTVITETIMIIIIMIIIKQRTGGVDWIRDVYLEWSIYMVVHGILCCGKFNNINRDQKILLISVYFSVIPAPFANWFS